MSGQMSWRRVFMSSRLWRADCCPHHSRSGFAVESCGRATASRSDTGLRSARCPSAAEFHMLVVWDRGELKSSSLLR